MDFGQLRSSAPRWQAILFRLRRRTLLVLHDLRRSLHWYLVRCKRMPRLESGTVAGAHQWCFIVGCNNSGTSLLQRVFDASGEVSTLPYEGQLYTRVLARAMRRGYERVYMEYADDLRIDAEAGLENVPRLVHDWTLDLDRPIKRIIMEKTPHNVLRMQWLQKAFPGCKFICLVRNGYAVSEGIMRKGKKSALRASRHWNRVHEEMLAQLEGIENYLIVRYEDLSESPDEISDKIGGFLELDCDRLRASLQNTRYISNMDDAIPRNVINLNDRSLQRLAAADLRIITEQAGAMLDRFGYQHIAGSTRH